MHIHTHTHHSLTPTRVCSQPGVCDENTRTCKLHPGCQSRSRLPRLLQFTSGGTRCLFDREGRFNSSGETTVGTKAVSVLVNSRVCLGSCRHGITARFEVSIFVAPGTIYQPSEVTLKGAHPRLLWMVTGMSCAGVTWLSKGASAHVLSRRRSQKQSLSDGLKIINILENWKDRSRDNVRWIVDREVWFSHCFQPL